MTQAKGERNFHIFYILLAGAESQYIRHLKLERNYESTLNFIFFYNYFLLKHISSGNVTDTHFIKADQEQYKHLTEAFKLMGVTPSEVHNFFEIVAAIIHLGQITFLPHGIEHSIVDQVSILSLLNRARLYLTCHINICIDI